MKYTLITLPEKVLIIGLWFYYPEQTIGSDLVQHLSYLYLFNGNRRTWKCPWSDSRSKVDIIFLPLKCHWTPWKAGVLSSFSYVSVAHYRKISMQIVSYCTFDYNLPCDLKEIDIKWVWPPLQHGSVDLMKKQTAQAAICYLKLKKCRTGNL